MCLGRREHTDTAVRPPCIIGRDGPRHREPRRFYGLVAHVPEELVLHDAVQPFADRVFLRVAVLCHAAGHVILAQKVDIHMAFELPAPVGVQERARIFFRRARQVPAPRQPDGLYDLHGQHTFADTKPHDEVRVLVQDEGRVAERAIPHRDVGNVHAPQLQYPCRRVAGPVVGRHRQAVAVSARGAAALALDDEQPLARKELVQGVPADAYALGFEFLVDHYI